MIAPDEVQSKGVGSPQALWMGAQGSKTNVWADNTGDVLVEAWHPFSRLTPEQARQHAARVVAAADWADALLAERVA